MTWMQQLRAALARDTPAFNPRKKPAKSCMDDFCSCQFLGHHTYSWPCDYAPGTGRLADEPEEGNHG